MQARLRLGLLVALTWYAAASTTSTSSDQAVALRYEWTAGEELTYRSTQETHLQATGAPDLGALTELTSMTEVDRFRVDDVALDGTATMHVRIVSLKMNASSLDGAFAFDSAQPPRPRPELRWRLLAEGMRALVGQTFTITVDTMGTVVRAEGIDEFWSRVRSYRPQVATALAARWVDRVFNDESLPDLLTVFLAYLPEGTVRVGDSWRTERIEELSPTKATVSSTVALESLEVVDGVELARIRVTEFLDFDQEGEGSAPPVKIDEAFGEGYVLFDRTRGVLRRAELLRVTSSVESFLESDGTATDVTLLLRSKTAFELLSE